MPYARCVGLAPTKIPPLLKQQGHIPGGKLKENKTIELN